jgi:hypothetical protein
MRRQEEDALIEARRGLDLPPGAADVHHPSLTVEIAQRVAATVGSGAEGTLATALAAGTSDPACYEASVRGGADTAPSAGRMMIECATRDVLVAIASALDLALPPAADRWLAIAEHEGVPVIAGWDLRGGGEGRCAKLYVNASDASRTVRERICDAALANLDLRGNPPAVVGMNARADGTVETKIYVQSADALALAQGHGKGARTLAATARDEGADAGGVLSYDAVGNRLEPRAFFIALREPADEAGWRCVRSLLGYDARAIESLLPFAPAAPRSIGISLAPHASSLRWTLYFKPRDSGRAPETLEPVAVYRAGDVEVGVFVEPTERAVRAFRRTERHAVSVRVRDGKPAAGALEPLVDWFTARLRVSESGGAGLAAYLADPPAPWRIIEVTRPTS